MSKPEVYGGFRWLVERRKSEDFSEKDAAMMAIQDIRSFYPTDVEFAESPLFPQILAFYAFDWKRMTAAIKEAIG